jgi:hypothetical protein
MITRQPPLPLRQHSAARVVSAKTSGETNLQRFRIFRKASADTAASANAANATEKQPRMMLEEQFLRQSTHLLA